jgi:hypothetical protein
MRTLLTGQQGTPALCPANRAFFLFFYFYFLAGQFFFVKKHIFSKKKNVSLSVSVSLFVHALWVFRGLIIPPT